MNAVAKRHARQHMVLLGDLSEHSVREVCQGAAEYAAGQSDLDFSAWPVFPRQASALTPADLRQANGLLLSEVAWKQVRGSDARLRVPHVFYLANHSHPRVPTVELDEAAIGGMAAEHLLARGYRQVAFVGSAPMRWSQKRGQGFKDKASAAGVAVKVFHLPHYKLPVFWSARLIKHQQGLDRILKMLPKPCGIFAANDVIACLIIETARALGFSVPDQVGVIGVDADPIPNASAGLAISSVVAPFREVGRRAAHVLDQLRKGRDAQLQEILPPVRVVVRTSTDVFMVSDTLLRKAQGYIESERRRRLCVSEVARAIGTSVVTLGQRFARHLGVTPANYILSRRLEYAKDLLRAGDMTVDQVSQACGFHSCAYSCHVFRKVAGTTPGHLRPGRLGQPSS